MRILAGEGGSCGKLQVGINNVAPASNIGYLTNPCRLIFKSHKQRGHRKKVERPLRQATSVPRQSSRNSKDSPNFGLR